jgi:LysM repeat protein
MHSRLRLPVIAIALAFVCSATAISRAQETAPAGTSLLDEVRALRQLVEQQTKQIQTLSDQVARLSARIDNGVAAGTPIPAAPPAAAAETPATPRVVAPPQPPPNSHIVVKGDSLEKIAKQHNTTVADLLKLNKIPDPKKIQIGQQIILPPEAAAAPAVDKPSEKKE